MMPRYLSRKVNADKILSKIKTFHKVGENEHFEQVEHEMNNFNENEQAEQENEHAEQNIYKNKLNKKMNKLNKNKKTNKLNKKINIFNKKMNILNKK